jgi:RNA polymerase sigma-70 factor (ECF subfamily)
MNGNLSTQAYWRQLREGNTDALSALYQLHYVGLINYGVKLTGDRDLATDSFTAVLLELWDKRNTLPDVTNVRAYLITCLHRKMLHEIASGKKRNNTHLQLNTGQETEWSHEDYILAIEGNDELSRCLTKAFQQLTQRQQQLLRMKFFDNLDYEHIAQVCGITKRTAYNIIYDALKQLKQELKGHEQAIGMPVSEMLLAVSLLLIFQ